MSGYLCASNNAFAVPAFDEPHRHNWHIEQHIELYPFIYVNQCFSVIMWFIKIDNVRYVKTHMSGYLSASKNAFAVPAFDEPHRHSST
jgi:hypothetical protein